MNKEDQISLAGPLPLVIGVTGHRDLASKDIARIQESLVALFTCLRRQYPHTPLRVLSPLAEGADRLVAKVALEHGAELVVPLPMGETEYRKDFPDTVAEFDALKSQASMVYTLPPPAEAANDAADLSGSRRDACYENVGLHIINHSQLIVALWDGIPVTDRGGTAQIVECALSRSWNTASAFHFSDDFSWDKVVWHLRIPRSNSHSYQYADVTPQYYEAVWRFSDEQTPDVPFAATDKSWPQLHFEWLHSMEVFNSEAISLPPRRVRESLDSLLPPGDTGKIIDPSERMTRVFAAADLISQKYQKTTYKIWKLIFVLAGTMILSFEGYTHLWPHGPLLLAYPAAFITMTIAYSVLNKRRMDDRYIDARVLAEALRVAIYWRLAGIQESVIDQYLGRHIAAITWLPSCILGLLTLPPPDIEYAQQDGLRIADTFWVDRQLGYYQRQSSRQGKRVNLYRRFAGSLYALTLVFSVCVAIYGVVVTTPSPLRDILIMLMASGPAVAVLWIAYAEKQGWERHVKEYVRNAALFARAHNLIAKLGTPRASVTFLHVQKVLLELGKEAVCENAEWALLHRVKPPKLPLG
ncbi:MAG: hypothetical protein KGL13_07670 [Gammaproteobacteria bacterium]|nr:hypothetical protein [Gammaproteobacteria bacterium]MDE2346332.1 hypothetical protein [Gammaproteobacteria bacterium]